EDQQVPADRGRVRVLHAHPVPVRGAGAEPGRAQRPPLRRGAGPVPHAGPALREEVLLPGARAGAGARLRHEGRGRDRVPAHPEDGRHHLRPPPGAERAPGGALRLPARPEEVHLLPPQPPRDLALLPLLHRLELRAARRLDRAHQLRARRAGPPRERAQPDAQSLFHLRKTALGREKPVHTLRKFYYITLLRDPVSRYLSEWRHVQRGATWKTSLHMCDGRTPTPEELPSCYEGTDWSGCTLQEFMDCPYNLANNRQVRMLADLSLVGCYNMSFIPENKRAQILLESAKKNLKDMAFFGLTEFQRKTQYLFERTFNLKFIRPFMQYNSTRAGGVEVDNDTIRRIEELNDLDMQLYDYAKDLFQQRYQYKRQLERMEQRIKNREERLLHRSNEALPKEETEEQGRLPTEDYMSHIIEKW
uniref:Heparan-sulfate 6-O-sulfotransferase n=1 Tax=Gallus gallus TaxID=9031 RepID=A0A8V0ZYC0_CHICK